MTFPRIAVLLVLALGAATPAAAQRVPFERRFDVTGPVEVDVSTIRGTIEVRKGEAGRVAVTGEATVRVGFNVPADALERARRFAADPAVRQEGNTIRLTPPAEDADRRALTVSYVVHVPAEAGVTVESGSGAVLVDGVSGRVSVRTDSSAIDLADLGGSVEVRTGSGDVDAAGIDGPFSVTTESSAVTGSDIGGDVSARTGSGAVGLALTGTGSVDIETGSSAVDVRGARAALRVHTQSGSVTIEGVPGADWRVDTGSSRVDASVSAPAGFRVDLASRSGRVRVEGADVAGTVSERAVTGTVGADGAGLVHVRTGSGAITVRVGHR